MMTDAQREAHQRMLAVLPARIVSDPNEPEAWAERDRALSPAEQAILDALMEVN